MNPSENQSLESVLKQMQLRAPSTRLDDSISQLASESRHELAVRNRIDPARFGWGPLVATALVAALAGLLIGSAYPLNALEGTPSQLAKQEIAAPDVAGEIVGDRAPGITPVKFNLQAYEMLHGHSTNSVYANCGACHQAGQDEAFEGWFYGDDDFFKKHGAGKLGKCSNCHEVAAQNQKKQQDGFQKAKQQAGFRHSDFPDANCSSCHGRVGGIESAKPQARLLTKPIHDEGSFHHHFEGVENCSNCHLAGKENPERQLPGLGPGEMRGFQHQQTSDCRKCHIVKSDLPKSDQLELAGCHDV